MKLIIHDALLEIQELEENEFFTSYSDFENLKNYVCGWK